MPDRSTSSAGPVSCPLRPRRAGLAVLAAAALLTLSALATAPATFAAGEPLTLEGKAILDHPAGKAIDPHVHNPVPRAIQMTQEVLVVRRGKIRVDFYDDQKNYLKSRALVTGDIILLAAGGHGFEVLEDLEMIEIKQGPYAGYADKVRFAAVAKEKVNFDS